MIRTDKRLRLCGVLLAGILCFIWGNSLLPAEESANLSGFVSGLLQRLFPGQWQEKCRPLLSRDVADPWYTGNFSQTWDDITEGCERILEELC